MRTTYLKSRSGISMVEVIVASAMAAGLAFAVAQLSRKATQGNTQVQNQATLANFKNVVTVINQDPEGWLKVYKAENSIIKNCLASAAPYSCPTAESVASDLILTAEATGKTISSVDMYDVNSIQFAGKTGSEVYFDSLGLPCMSGSPSTDRNCRYKSTGYMIRPNTMPGQVSFVRKLEQTAQTITTESPKMQPIYEKINIGLMWQSTSDNAPAVGSILAYAGDPADGIPGGFLLADGSEVDIATHPKLYAVVGTSWGAATDPNKFKLPDLRGYFVRGASATNTLGSTQASSYMSHYHTASLTASGTLSLTNVSVPISGFLSSFTGGAPWFNGGGEFNGTVSTGPPYPNLTVWPTGQINGAVTSATANPGTVNPNSVSFNITPVFASSGASETRPVNAAVIYMVRDDYEQ